MSQQIINIGSLPNDGNGDSLRTAFGKINNNFTELYAYSSSNTFTITVGTSTQTILEVPANTFTRGSFEIYSIQPPELITVAITTISSTATNFTVALPSIPTSWAVGTKVIISNTTPASYNGEWAISSIGVGTVTITSAINPGVSTVNGTINSYASQIVNIDAFSVANKSDIKFTAHSTVFYGGPVTKYSMDVNNGNVRLRVEPVINDVVQHYVNYKITNSIAPSSGMPIALSGYVNSVLATSNGLVISTSV
jgi:hypothetical protein